MVSVTGYRAWSSAMRSRAFFRRHWRAVVLLCGVASQPLHAQTYKVLHTFLGANQGDGSNPYAGLVRDASGNLYGTTYRGGRGGGIVFELSATGMYSQPHYFRGGKDGKYVMGGLVLDGAGNLYGTSYLGGVYGVGTVFRVRSIGREAVLYPFKGGTTDGAEPAAGLVRDSSGSLYGTTRVGGKNDFGVVFKVEPNGSETVLYKFRGGTNGWGSQAGLVRDPSGNLYGTTVGGGSSGNGTIFELAMGGTESVLHSFTGGADGAGPIAGLLRDGAGNFYGTTPVGGDMTCGCGTVFKLDANGDESTLYRFTGANGSEPLAGLVRDAKGNLYGTTSAGGGLGFGTVFKLNKAGVLTTLYNFTGGLDGAVPRGTLVIDASGNLYGTASKGGNQENDCRDVDGCGVVFEVIP